MRRRVRRLAFARSCCYAIIRREAAFEYPQDLDLSLSLSSTGGATSRMFISDPSAKV